MFLNKKKVVIKENPFGTKFVKKALIDSGYVGTKKYSAMTDTDDLVFTTLDNVTQDGVMEFLIAYEDTKGKIKERLFSVSLKKNRWIGIIKK